MAADDFKKNRFKNSLHIDESQEASAGHHIGYNHVLPTVDEDSSIYNSPTHADSTDSGVSSLRRKLKKMDLSGVDLSKSYEMSNTTLRVKEGFVIDTSGVVRTPNAQLDEHGKPIPSPRGPAVPPLNKDALNALALSPQDNTETKSPVALGKHMSASDVVEYDDAGKGQNGVVRKALYLRELDIVCLKAINGHDTAKRHQLIKELSAFEQTHHPNIITLLGAFLNQGMIVMALEYMNRGSLNSLVRKHGPLSEMVIALFARQILQGLEYLHSQHQVHRDIKPDNILANHNGVVKISDFGLAKQLNSSEDFCNTFVGTTAYLSPERVVGQEFSYPSDIWSVGISLIFCATGAIPLPSEYWALVTSIQKSSPKLDPNVFSPQLCDFVDKCLKKDPKERATATQLLQHPFITGSNTSMVEGKNFPLHGATDQDVEDCHKVCRILIEYLYADAVKFKNSLYDKARLQRIGEQLGLNTDEVLAIFMKEFNDIKGIAA